MSPKPHPSPITRHRLSAALLYWLWLPAMVISSGLAIDLLASQTRLTPGLGTLIGGGLLLTTGLGMIVWSSRDLARLGQGTPSPARPCRKLVTTGSYGFCRHPMFLGYDLAALAVLLFIGSPAALLISYPAMLAWQIRFLRREEQLLARRFAGEYPAYRTKVPFLIPLWHPNLQ